MSVYSADEGTSFYVCGTCHMACDTIFSLSLGMECHDDTRTTSEVTPLLGHA